MRLSALQRQILTQTARDFFEPDVRVRLFGSRMDDTRKGGGIDLLIETQLQDPGQIARAHSQFLARVHLALGEQKCACSSLSQLHLGPRPQPDAI